MRTQRQTAVQEDDHQVPDHQSRNAYNGATPAARARQPHTADEVPDATPSNAAPRDTALSDAMQSSRLTALGHSAEIGRSAELEGQEELGPQLAWVSLDAPRGLLVCKNLDLEVTEFIGTIIESRVVRVMKDKDGGVFCASSNRLTADVGRPGRECAPCEDRGSCCFPRWWIAWQEEETGQIFAHTLSQTGTLNFTRYAARLGREGLTPSQVTTRLFVEEARRQKAGTVYRRLQFERDDPFARE